MTEYRVPRPSGIEMTPEARLQFRREALVRRVTYWEQREPVMQDQLEHARQQLERMDAAISRQPYDSPREEARGE